MKKLEEKALRTFHKMWEAWCTPNWDGLDEALDFYADEFHGYGSALHELWKGKEDIKAFYIKSGEINPGGFMVEPIRLEAKSLGDEYVTIWGELRIKIIQEVKTLVIEPMRITVLLRDHGDTMKIIQSHSSLPDMTQEDELWPGTGKPKLFKEASILFTDFVGFTKYVARVSADFLVSELNILFAEFDDIARKHDLEKVKTIGDSYMAAGGLYDQDSGQAVETVQAAKDMLTYLNKRNKASELHWNMRIGIHTGPVVGGVLGTEKLRFDLWGETVNIASRIESTSKPNKINVSAYTYSLIKDNFDCEYRGQILTKDEDLIDMYFVQ